MNAYEQRSNQLISYMKLHLISLEQDSENISKQIDEFDGNMNSWDYQELTIKDVSTNGQIFATRHLLSVASDILGIELEEK